jgi:TldD protein
MADPATTHAFLAWFGIDEALVRRVLEEALSRGADFADAYFQHERSTSLGLEDGIISRASTQVDQGVGVRAVLGDQVGYAYSESLELPALLRAARTAASIAAGGPRSVRERIDAPGLPDAYALARAWETVGIAERLPLVREVEALARRADPCVTKVSVTFGDSDERVLVATSDGAWFVDRRPMATLRVAVTAVRGSEVQSNAAALAFRDGIEAFTPERLADVARKAVERTLVLFDARRPPAGEMPVVLAAGASAILLHEAIGHGLEADANRKGISIYSTLLGQRVAPDFVTVVDDGTQRNDRGALNVDDEGTPTERTVLIENGILRGYMHDRISARHYGVAPTGSGRRQSFRHVPIPRMRSTCMLAGPHGKDEILAAVEHGIVAETFTNGQVAIGAGDFTFFVKNGWLVEGGRITAPIKNVNLIGNGPEVLRQVEMAADDPIVDGGTWTCGKAGQGVPVSMGMPTVLVRSGITVGGTSA